MPATAHPLAQTVLPGITDRQAQSLRFFFDYYQANRCYPFLHEVAKGVGYQRASAAACLKPLLTKGLLQRNNAVSRNYELTPLGLEKLAQMGVKVAAKPAPTPLQLPVAPKRMAQAMSAHADEPEREVYFLVEFNASHVTRCAGGFNDPQDVSNALARWQDTATIRPDFYYRMLKLSLVPGTSTVPAATKHSQDGPESHSPARSKKGRSP